MKKKGMTILTADRAIQYLTGCFAAGAKSAWVDTTFMDMAEVYQIKAICESVGADYSATLEKGDNGLTRSQLKVSAPKGMPVPPPAPKPEYKDNVIHVDFVNRKRIPGGAA